MAQNTELNLGAGAVAEAGFEDRVRYLSHGETYDFEVARSRWQSA